MYEYKIQKVGKVVDGDTIDVVVDLGFHTFVKKRVRLYGINTPETRTRNKEEKAKGIAAKLRLVELCEAPTLILKSRGLGKYGRVLGEIISNDINLNKLLVSEGHAEEYHG